MCLTVVGLSVARGVCRGGEEGEEGERGSWPYGGDGHNVAAATQGASPPSIPLQLTMLLLLTSLSSGVFKQDWYPSWTTES